MGIHFIDFEIFILNTGMILSHIGTGISKFKIKISGGLTTAEMDLSIHDVADDKLSRVLGVHEVDFISITGIIIKIIGCYGRLHM